LVLHRLLSHCRFLSQQVEGITDWYDHIINLYSLFLNLLQYSNKEALYQMHEINPLGIPKILRRTYWFMSRSRIFIRLCLAGSV
jgi:hypothetical protein